MTRKTAASCAIHSMVGCASTWAAIRALPPAPVYCAVAAGFGAAAVWTVLGFKWEFEWQRKVARVLTWWDRDGCAEAAWAFPIGSLLGTAAAVLWR